jgi:hypothetical protein
MSDSDSDHNDQSDSTIGLVPESSSGRVGFSLRDHLPHHAPRSHRRSSDVTNATSISGGPSAKIPVFRINSGGGPRASPAAAASQHRPSVSSHHHNNPAGNHRVHKDSGDDAAAEDELPPAHQLDTINEDPSSPSSPAVPCTFTIGSASPQVVANNENPLVASIREQLARDFRGVDTGSTAAGAESSVDACEMKILDLLGKKGTTHSNNNGDLAVNPNESEKI